MLTVQKGDRVRIKYEGFLDDGRIFDSTENHGFPMKLTVGTGIFLEGFENALLGMKVGQEKSIRLPPLEAYGIHIPSLIEVVPRESIPAKKILEIGTLLIITSENGDETPAKVINLTDEEVTLDFNHPLAGITLNYRISLLEIIKES